ncbi:MAG: histone deacetylase [Planctomycetes bacterium]|nr:histone deacetylase [Planctomycetota bacterium]NUQ35774.1 histone deacetylase [Planctomycetaceae bacterium]
MALFLAYDPGYTLNFSEHVFPVRKYELIAAELIKRGVVGERDFLKPDPATDEQLLLAHTPEFLERLRRYAGTNPMAALHELEAPCYPETLVAKRFMTGGSILVTEKAIEAKGCGVNIGGGFHHAEADRGGGFCFLNDIVISIRVAQKKGFIRRALVIDTDVHQGNGTASIVLDDTTIRLLDIHQRDNYPTKVPAELNIGLEDGCGDREYIEGLKAGIEKVIGEHGPFDLIHYVAGADPWKDDKLGGLKLSMDGFRARDRLLIVTAKKLSVPLIVTLAGGYAQRTADTVNIHAQMVEEMIAVYGKK